MNSMTNGRAILTNKCGPKRVNSEHLYGEVEDLEAMTLVQEFHKISKRNRSPDN
jgi:hypothetical protein